MKNTLPPLGIHSFALVCKKGFPKKSNAIMLLGVLLFSSAAMAQIPFIPNEDTPERCHVTPTIAGAARAYPGRDKIIHSNKLAMPAGKAVYAQGEIIYLQGRVYDEFCVPVEGASIEIWQADTTGKYKWEKWGELKSPAPSFAGSGQAITNNLGEYQFLTVFPSPYGNRAPHIHFRVTHPDFSTLNTEVFFAEDRRNLRDPNLNRLPASLRNLLTAQVTLPNPNLMPESYLVARFEIVLRGQNKFKHY
jgi:protocatechuate 3,4-dioxygenase beta subunit